jgi:methylated-DNA-[protein]-cysteine S-methyltransferase
MGRNNKNPGFSEKVWHLCSRIPKGKVTTYKIIAEKLGTNAYRAVGNALNKNPHWPEVPCHRVIGSDGSLTGFASGLRKKEQLLKKEGIKIKNGKIACLNKVLFRF